MPPADALDALGARRGPRLGRPGAVLDFGDPSSEARALAQGAGAVPLVGFAAWEAAGSEAASFLQRMLTQDLRGLGEGEARPALVIDARGRVHGDPLVWKAGGRILLAMEPAAALRAVPLLERHVVADDAAFLDASGPWGHALVAGPLAARASAAAAPALAALGGFACRADLRGLPCVRVLCPAQALGAALDALRAAGAAPAGEEALDVARVLSLWPWHGFELDERVLPNEAALDAAVSWTKGCYLGQEPVVTARHRGHPPSLLVRLAVEGASAPARETALLDASGGAVGRVTTAVRDPRDGSVRALAYLRWALARAAPDLRLPDGVRARVEAVAGE